MICGNWFTNYYVLKDDGFNYIEVEDIKSGVEEMFRVLEDETIRKEIKNKNSLVGFKKYLWSECIKDFVNTYKQFLK